MHNACVLDAIKTVELTRPFAFLIYDRSNDEILFIGKVISIS